MFVSGVFERNVAEQNTKQQSKTYANTGILDIQISCLVTLHGEQRQTALNRCGMLDFDIEFYLDLFIVMMITK